MNDTVLATNDKNLRMICKGVNEGIVFNECFAQNYTQSSSLLQEVKKQSSMQDPILRYLAIQSYHLFESVQNMIEFDLDTVVTKSREYRAILTECEDQIVNEIRIMDSKSNNDELKYNFATTYCNTIRDYQMLWHLSEIFFIKLSSSGFFIQDLLGWLNLQQPNVSFNYNQLMDKYNNANGDIELQLESTYWPTVLSLAMQCRKSELLNLLICHPLANGQAMRAVRTVVELLPVFSEEYVKCPLEFDIVWKNWNKFARTSLIDCCILGPFPELVFLADILLGKKEVFFSSTMIDLVDGSWYYAIVPYILYSQPLIKAQEISSCYKDFRRGFQKAVTQFDNVATEVCSEQILQAIKAIFSLDLGEFIGSITRNSNDWWLPAHLVDLIAKISPHLFPDPLTRGSDDTSCLDNDSVCTLKEFLVVKYASGLTSHHSMTLMALNYLHYCPVEGADQISHIIGAMHLDTDRMATMIHSWCVQRKYDDIATTICKRRAMTAFRNDKFGNSVVWSVKCNDVNFISRIADRLIKIVLSLDCTNEKWFDLLDCVKNISIGIYGKKITFVTKFHEVLRLIEAKKYGEAAECVMKLLESQLLSRHYNIEILRSIRPLLDVSGTFGSDDILGLMQLLEEAVTDPENATEVNELRLLLVRELSHACLV